MQLPTEEKRIGIHNIQPIGLGSYTTQLQLLHKEKSMEILKALILTLMFAPMIYLAFRQKKWYLYLLVGFMGILPEQFAVSIHESLPLLSGTRILILIATGFWVCDKWKAKKFTLPKSILIYFAINVIISLVNIPYGLTGEIKRIFLMFFERIFLVIMLADFITSREEFDRSIDFLIMGCCVLSVIGIVQSVFEFDLASALHLRETLASVSISNRMGMIRAFGTFNAISYGCYCAFISLLILYRLYNTKKLWYAIALSLNLMALVCTFTRSAWLCIGGIVLIMLILYRTRLIRRLLSTAGLTLLLCVVLCIAQPKLLGALSETGKSVANTLLAFVPDSVVSMFTPSSTQSSANMDDNTETTEPSSPNIGFELSEDFGLNGEDPTYSRTAQWSAVTYMIRQGKLLFGYGYNALAAGRLHFFYDRWGAEWQVATYLDVGLVALLTEGGLLGAISHLALLAYMFICSLVKKRNPDTLSFYEITIFMIPLYLLLNFLAAFLFADLVWLFIGLFFAYKRIDPDNSKDRDLLRIPHNR